MHGLSRATTKSAFDLPCIYLDTVTYVLHSSHAANDPHTSTAFFNAYNSFPSHYQSHSASSQPHNPHNLYHSQSIGLSSPVLKKLSHWPCTIPITDLATTKLPERTTSNGSDIIKRAKLRSQARPVGISNLLATMMIIRDRRIGWCSRRCRG